MSLKQRKTTMKKLAIIGAGGHAKVIADIAKACGWSDVTFFDDLNSELPSFKDMIDQKANFQGFFVAIGNNQVRHDLLLKLQSLKLPIPNLIHPSAVLSPSARLGAGVAVMPLVAVNAQSSIGDGCILNTSASIDHDCHLGFGVHISPGANLAGGVSVGELSWIGIGSCVIEKIKIGAQVQVAAGAAVVNDLLEPGSYIGVPAKKYK